MKRTARQHFLLLFGILLFSANATLKAQTREIINTQNEYGGETIQHSNEDYSRLIVYYDGDRNLIREETIFTSDYQIDNNLEKIVVQYYFGKKVFEEKRYNRAYAFRTLIEKSITHYDRNTGDQIKQENHFISPFSGYNIIFRDKGKKTRIEWYYPDNVDGIKVNIVFLDASENPFKTESFYTDKSVEDHGCLKRIYYTAYNQNRYMRKTKQEWYYTEKFSQMNHNIAKKVEIFHYSLGEPPRIETLLFDRNEAYINK